MESRPTIPRFLATPIKFRPENEVSGEVFQIAAEASIRELAAMVQEVAGKTVEVCHSPARQGDIRKNYSVVSKVEAMLDWEPRVRLVNGLRETQEWLRKGSPPWYAAMTSGREV